MYTETDIIVMANGSTDPAKDQKDGIWLREKKGWVIPNRAQHEIAWGRLYKLTTQMPSMDQLKEDGAKITDEYRRLELQGFGSRMLEHHPDGFLILEDDDMITGLGIYAEGRLG